MRKDIQELKRTMEKIATTMTLRVYPVAKRHQELKVDGPMYQVGPSTWQTEINGKTIDIVAHPDAPIEIQFVGEGVKLEFNRTTNSLLISAIGNEGELVTVGLDELHPEFTAQFVRPETLRRAQTILDRILERVHRLSVEVEDFEHRQNFSTDSTLAEVFKAILG